MGLQVARDYVFVAYLFGEVHVFELATGKLVEILPRETPRGDVGRRASSDPTGLEAKPCLR